MYNLDLVNTGHANDGNDALTVPEWVARRRHRECEALMHAELRDELWRHGS
eukprot:COSAG01_NODE_57480_length_312_cov_0.633803_1_plen_50_part_10